MLNFQNEVQGPDFTNNDCAGSGFEITFGSDTFNEANPTGMANILSAAGCDSTFNVVLNFQNEVQGPDFTNNDCAGSGFEITFGNDTFNEANPTGMATILSAAGCDSTFNVVLNFADQSTNTIEEVFCLGQNSEIIVGTQVFNETNPTGVTVLSNQNAQGCDSIVTVNLTFEDIFFELRGDESICNDETAIISIVTNSTESFDLTLNDSDGNEITFPNLQNNSTLGLTPESTLTYFVTNINGIECDLDLTSLFLEVQVSNIEVEILPDGIAGLPLSCISFDNLNLEAVVNGGIGDIDYLWNQGNQTPTLDIFEPGSFNVIVTDEFGCTDTETFELQEADSVQIDFTALGSPCNSDVGTISIFDIDLSSGNGFSLFLDDMLNPIEIIDFPVQVSTNNGAHELVVIDDGGCRFVETFEILDVEQNEITIPTQESLMIEPDGSIPLNIIADFVIDSISWNMSPDLTCTECFNPIASPINTTTFTAEVFDIQGCSATVNIIVTVDGSQNVFIPNVFSPNDDGFNDLFYVFGSDAVALVRELSIFDRWGNQVFFMEDVPANDPAFSWNGEFRGEKMQAGVFVYYAIIEFNDGSELLVEGNVTLMK